ncbi:MAG: hypothetical protein GX757_09750 [Clostridiales bacterium]|nr:hypothetical protein [Clostridiales bacterium]
MGLIKSLFGRKKRQTDMELEYEYEEAQQLPDKPAKKINRLGSSSERLTYIRDNCEQIMEYRKQIEEAKLEYKAVTSYLTDIQRIDMVPLDQRGSIEEAARNIYNLTRERNKLKNRSSILTDSQYHLLEQYEPVVQKDLAKIINCEDYQAKIEQDLAKLEKERKRLNREYSDIKNKQSFLKGLAIVISAVVGLLFIMFIILSSIMDANYSIPFMMTVLMGTVSAVFIFMEARKNVVAIKLVQSKLNRQIMLMNKVKIKSVNNRNYLEYEYSKYNVDNGNQLKQLWDEYVRIKEESRKYLTNTQLLEFNNNTLIKELKKFGVADAEIWIFQPLAIIDSKEMVEVRHRLNERRQKLRERIDLNTKQMEEALNEIKSIMEKYPDIAYEGEKLLQKYKIQND